MSRPAVRQRSRGQGCGASYGNGYLGGVTAPIQRDSSEQAELPDLPFPSTSIEELLRSFVKALRAHQLYLPNNPIYKAAIDAVRDAFVPVWEETDELVFDVHGDAGALVRAPGVAGEREDLGQSAVAVLQGRRARADAPQGIRGDRTGQAPHDPAAGAQGVAGRRRPADAPLGAGLPVPAVSVRGPRPGVGGAPRGRRRAAPAPVARGGPRGQRGDRRGLHGGVGHRRGQHGRFRLHPLLPGREGDRLPAGGDYPGVRHRPAAVDRRHAVRHLRIATGHGRAQRSGGSRRDPDDLPPRWRTSTDRGVSPPRSPGGGAAREGGHAGASGPAVADHGAAEPARPVGPAAPGPGREQRASAGRGPRGTVRAAARRGPRHDLLLARAPAESAAPSACWSRRHRG